MSPGPRSLDKRRPSQSLAGETGKSESGVEAGKGAGGKIRRKIRGNTGATEILVPRSREEATWTETGGGSDSADEFFFSFK